MEMGNPIEAFEQFAGRVESNTVLRAVMSTSIEGDQVATLLSGSSNAVNARALAPDRMVFHAGVAFPLAGEPDAETGESFVQVIFPGAVWNNPVFSTSSNDHAGSANSNTGELLDKLAAGRIRVEF